MVCHQPYATHSEAVRAICAADGTLSFYIGDADILSAHVEAMRGAGAACPVTFQSVGKQSEPYALIVGTRIPDLPRLVTLGIYDFFRSGEADRSFAENFGERRKSPVVQTLFELYHIPTD